MTTFSGGALIDIVMFKQITALGLPTEVTQPFCVEATEHNDFLIASKTMVHCLTQFYQPNAFKNCFDLSFAKFPCPKVCPTEKIPVNEVKVFGNACRSEQQEILLDQTLMPQLSTPYLQTKCARMAPYGMGDNKDRMIAYLNTFGGLEVGLREKNARSYVKISDISEEWRKFVMQTNDVTICQSVKELKKLNADVVVTTFCWKPTLDSKIGHLMCATRSGKLVLWSIREGGQQANLEMVLKTDCKTIQALKWISVADKNYLIVGNYEGKLDLFQIDLTPTSGICSKIEPLASLWDSADKIIVSHIEYELVETTSQILITCVKDAHEYIGNLAITGLQQMRNLTYVVCTSQNTITKVSVKIDSSNNLSIYKTAMKTDMNLDKFSTYGVTASRNLAYWLFVVYPRQAFDHLTLRQPLQIFICSLDLFDAYDILKKSCSIEDMQDCAECVRYYGLKDVTTTKTLEASELGLEFLEFRITKPCIYKLRLYLLGMVARTSYYRYRNAAQANVFTKCCQFLESVLQCIRYYQILQLLHVSHTKVGAITTQQLVTGKYLRKSLLIHIADQQFDELKEFQALIASLFEVLIEETAFLDAVETNELCMLCGEMVSPDQLTCSSQHVMARCAFSRKQVPFLKDYKKCGQCNRVVALTDDNLLNEVVFNDQSLLLCPICNIELTVP